MQPRRDIDTVWLGRNAMEGLDKLIPLGSRTVDMDIGVIGGAGHVGLPLGIVLADAGFKVSLIDKDEAKLATIEDGTLPYREPGGEQLLDKALATGKLKTTTSLEVVANCDAVFVVIGTPIDEHQNPQMDRLLDLIEELTEHLREDQLLSFRSTLYPGTTNIVRDRLSDAGFEVGENIYLSFAPERIAQHKAFQEVVELPQLIGSFDDESFERTRALFDVFLESECYQLNPTEAELGKLFTNMWRYLTFAAANEFYLITESFAKHHDVNVHRILDQTSKNYPRFDVPSPGANVGGPCLTKDGWFLVDNIPYNELVTASYRINEGMPAQVVDRMADLCPDPDKITLLGMTFKRNSDDLRNSVSFAMRKHLRRKGYNDIVEVEPNIEGLHDLSDAVDSDWVILMTPHEEFDELERIVSEVNNNDCLYCDLWGHWGEMKYESRNGFFFANEIGAFSPVEEGMML